MPLNDYWDTEPGQGGAYLEAGWHDVRTTDFRLASAHSGNKGVEFTVADKDGRRSKTSAFWFSDGSLPHLAKFAKACGMTREQAAMYEPTREDSHRMLLNKPLRVLVEKGSKGYHEVTDYEPRKGAQGSAVPVAPPLQPFVEPVPFDPEPTLAPDEDVF